MFYTTHYLILLSGYAGWPLGQTRVECIWTHWLWGVRKMSWVPQVEHVLPPKIDSRKEIGKLRYVAGGVMFWCDNSNLSLNVSKTKEIAVFFWRSMRSSLSRHGNMVQSVRSTKSLGYIWQMISDGPLTPPPLSKGHTMYTPPMTDEESKHAPSAPHFFLHRDEWRCLGHLPSIEELLQSWYCSRAPPTSWTAQSSTMILQHVVQDVQKTTLKSYQSSQLSPSPLLWTVVPSSTD